MNQSEGDRYWKEEADKFASMYDEQGGRLSPKRQVRDFLDSRTRHLEQMMEIESTDSILDLGCGSGEHIAQFASRCKSITGADYSLQMIHQATELCKPLATDNFSLEVCDAHFLPFHDKKFNTVLSMGLLDYVTSPLEVLHECHRVMKTNGLIFVTIPKSPSLFFFLRTGIGNILRRKLFDLPPIDNTVRKAAMRKLVADAGFELVEARSIWTTMWLIKARKA